MLGHWGASPGLAFIYTHLNRVIKNFDLNMIFLAGPGHGAPGVLGPVYLEGSYSEVYPDKSQDERGLRVSSRSFLFPAASAVTALPKRRARSTKVASSVMCCHTPAVLRSITPT